MTQDPIQSETPMTLLNEKTGEEVQGYHPQWFDDSAYGGVTVNGIRVRYTINKDDNMNYNPFGYGFISTEEAEKLEPKLTSIDIAPTPDSWPMLKAIMQDALPAYARQRQHYEELRALVMEKNFGDDTSEIHDLIEEAVDKKLERITEAEKSLHEGIVDIERCEQALKEAQEAQSCQ